MLSLSLSNSEHSFNAFTCMWVSKFGEQQLKKLHALRCYSKANTKIEFYLYSDHSFNVSTCI